MNWKAWLWGLMVAVLTAVLTGLMAWVALPDNVTTKQIIGVCLIPGLGVFLAWLKQTPFPNEIKKVLMVLLVFSFFIGSMGCSQIAIQSIKTDEEFHKAILDVATTRMKYVSCDVGLIDGLGIASVVDFPITTAGEARALLTNPAISLALGQIKVAAKATNDETGVSYWKDADYSKCQVLGLGYRAAALGTIDILKLFPQLSPYLTIFGK